MTEPADRIRLDKWLWFARFFKTRGLATRTVAGGSVRVNAERTSKPAHSVGPGDTLTFPQGRRIRVVRIVAPGTRRGPAPEAQALYEDLTPEPSSPGSGPVPERGGRPTKRDRREAEAVKKRGLE